MANVKIAMSGHGLGEVFIDGNKILGVRAISFSSEVGGVNTVKLDLLSEVCEIDNLETSQIVDVTNIGSTAREYVKVSDAD